MKIIENALTANIYTKLRNTGPFVSYDDEDIEISLKNSLHSVVVFDDSYKAIGIARIIGDNRITFIIKDVVVLPIYQNQGIGELLIKNLFSYIDKHACENAYIGLMSTIHKEGFYEKYGFIRRPNENYGAGMVMFYKKENFK